MLYQLSYVSDLLYPAVVEERETGLEPATSSFFLGFHNNHKPEDLTGDAFVDGNRRQLVLLSKDSSRHRRMGIIIGN